MIETYPDADFLQYMQEKTPKHMHPQAKPHAVVAESEFSSAECDALRNSMQAHNEYAFGLGAATTQEAYPPPAEFAELIRFVHSVNQHIWKFDLDTLPHVWLQTYIAGGMYPRHTDAAPGQSRKLTAVVLLSPEADYTGGVLSIHPPPYNIPISRKQGTIVIFPGWVPHEVSPISAGQRKTINVGFYGPPFK